MTDSTRVSRKVSDSYGFDPYHKWLGIPHNQQPPNHYQLLGVGLFEEDPEVIERAADRQMGHLRTYRAGRYQALSQKLLNEVAAARVCLLKPQSKAKYDSTLHRQSAKPFPSAPPVSQTEIDKSGEFDWDEAEQAAFAACLRRKGRKSAAPPMVLALAMGLIAVLLALGIAFLVFPSLGARQRKVGPDPAESREAKAVSPEHHAPKNAASPSRDRRSAASKSSAPPAVPAKPTAPEPEKPQATIQAGSSHATDEPSGLSNEEFKERLNAIRKALARRLGGRPEATGICDGGDPQSGGPARYLRLSKLADCLEHFWTRLAQVVSGLETAEEFDIGGTRALVVRANRKELVLREDGRNCQYLIRNMPHRLVEVLADRDCNGSPSSMALLGRLFDCRAGPRTASGRGNCGKVSPRQERKVLPT